MAPNKIVMLKTDENGNILGKLNEEVSTTAIDYSKLSDGLYVLYRGTDWVFGNDGSLVNTALIYEGQSQVFSQNFTKTTEIKDSSSTGVTFGPEYVKIAITQAYEKTISDSTTKEVTINQTSPMGKETFYKIYLTYARYDVVRLEGGKATHSATTYEFMGGRSVITQVEKGQGSSIDTSKLVIKEDTCLLQEVNDSIWQIVDNTPNMNISTIGRDGSNIFDLNKNMNFNTFSYNSPSCSKFNFIFKIREAGTYLFYVGNVVNLDFCKLNIEARDQVSRIQFKKADGVNDNYIKMFVEGGNYVLTLTNNLGAVNSYPLLIQKQ
ncbi:enterotoxin [Paraclostridium sordellii]|uniref:enterotoxin n=1 Tax=Paraclostridium sordellii TaxID=1505 RepID=UPI0005DEAE7D|nr:enterotoxin [Paeniclostridium sordellii]CEN86361.1 enterotoxin Cpe [[Clostridium] sordellii] [Paeniclostridium sordellii]